LSDSVDIAPKNSNGDKNLDQTPDLPEKGHQT